MDDPLKLDLEEAMQRLRRFCELRPSYPDYAMIAHSDYSDAIRMGHLRALCAPPEALRSGWIPVAERLPTLESDKYLVWFQDQHAVLEYDSQCGWCWGSGDKMLDRSQKEITHWMPLPEAPK